MLLNWVFTPQESDFIDANGNDIRPKIMLVVRQETEKAEINMQGSEVNGNFSFAIPFFAQISIFLVHFFVCNNRVPSRQFWFSLYAILKTLNAYECGSKPSATSQKKN